MTTSHARMFDLDKKARLHYEAYGALDIILIPLVNRAKHSFAREC